MLMKLTPGGFFFAAMLPGVVFKGSLKAFTFLDVIPNCSHILSTWSCIRTTNCFQIVVTKVNVKGFQN